MISIIFRINGQICYQFNGNLNYKQNNKYVYNNEKNSNTYLYITRIVQIKESGKMQLFSVLVDDNDRVAHSIIRDYKRGVELRERKFFK